MGYFAESSGTNVSARGITELKNILFMLDFGDKQGNSPTNHHAQANSVAATHWDWICCWRGRNFVAVVRAVWAKSISLLCGWTSEARSSWATERWERQRRAELTWRMGESPRNACGIGLSCPQSILSTVGHNIWPPAVAPKEHRLPIISVLHLPVPCRCPRYRHAVRNGYMGKPVRQGQVGLGCPRNRFAK